MRGGGRQDSLECMGGKNECTKNKINKNECVGEGWGGDKTRSEQAVEALERELGTLLALLEQKYLRDYY
jgi:hypothetical protein